MATKLKASRRIATGLAVAVWGSVLSIGLWRICKSEAAQEEEYLNAACDMLIASWGHRWACKQLETLSGSSFHSPPPKTKGLDDGREGQFLEHQRVIEAMACFHSLHVAAYYGDSSIVQTLLENDINPNLSNEYFGSALFAASYSGHTDIARLLIEHGAALDGKGLLGTPLEAAAYQGHVEILRLLLDRWINVGSNDRTTRCLLYASEQGHTRAVQLLLERRDVDVNARDHIGQSPLLLAARNGHLEVARRELPLESFSSLSSNLRAPEMSQECLRSMFREHVSRAPKLLKRGITDSSGYSALGTARCTPKHPG